MGQFANVIFSGLLGWVQAVVSGLWGLVTRNDVSAWMRWLTDNWLPLTLLLCAAGLLIDLLVYFIRWQPYRVWGGFLRRIIGGRSSDDAQEELEDETQFQRRWVYADGTTSVEDLRKAAQDDAAAEDDHLELPIRPVRRTAAHGTAEQAYYQPVYPPQWQQKTNDHSGGNE